MAHTQSPITIDTCTHILPAAFEHDRERIAREDRTFRALFPNSPSKSKFAQIDDLIASMDEAGIDVSVAAGFGWTNPEIARASNDYNLEAARLHPERIVAFCSVNPLWGQDAVDEIHRCHSQGAKGLGELHPDTQGILDADLSALAPVLDTAKELGMPTLIHASEPVGHGYPGKGTVTPELLMALVTAFPNNKFIFSHFGGGLPFYALMPEVKTALKNVHFDSAAFPFLYRPEVFDVTVRAIGAEKILFASDFPLVTQERALDEFGDSGLTPDQSRLVRGDNAAKLLNLQVIQYRHRFWAVLTIKTSRFAYAKICHELGDRRIFALIDMSNSLRTTITNAVQVCTCMCTCTPTGARGSRDFACCTC